MTNRKDSKVRCECVTCAVCGSDRSGVVASGFDYEYWTVDQKFTFVNCLDCGHLYLNPRPIRSEADSIYPKNYYTLSGRHTSRSSKTISFFKNIIIKKRLSFFNQILDSNASVLEVGSGDCSLLISLKKTYPRLNLSGIDLAYSDIVKSQCSEIGIALIEGAIEDLRLPESAYDLVIMNQLIEHLWDPQGVVSKIGLSLKPAGFISIETPEACGYDRQFFFNSFWGGYYFPRHMNLFSFDSIKRLLEKNGFSVTGHYSLVAPIVWAFSFKAFFCRTRNSKHRGGVLDRFFSDANSFCLAFFSFLDICAIFFGLTTSNQKIIARKNEKT
ncbi:MAG: class I SAM-dependent methyltransferase [Candidatus Omnitrophica bacterium]|nr:class I SAM-dependent methyltransferase [Candidatus Omnitrophota bacterium]